MRMFLRRLLMPLTFLACLYMVLAMACHKVVPNKDDQPYNGTPKDFLFALLAIGLAVLAALGAGALAR